MNYDFIRGTVTGETENLSNSTINSMILCSGFIMRMGVYFLLVWRTRSMSGYLF